MRDGLNVPRKVEVIVLTDGVVVDESSTSSDGGNTPACITLSELPAMFSFEVR